MKCNTSPYDPCPLGVINSKCIVYTGSNLTNINVSTNERLDVILTNINNSLNNLSFTLYTEDTATLDLSGQGTLQNPLYGDVNLSGFPNNSLLAFNDGLWSPNVIQHGVVYGGIVTWLQDYDYHISAAQYYINGILYNSPAADFTLSPPDGVYNRIDTFIVDTTGSASVLEGTPSDNPAQAGVDTTSQLQLSLALVEVGTTEPTIATECIYKNNNEGPTWTNVSSNTTRLNPDSVTNPCNGTKSIEATGLLTGDNILFTRNANFTPGTSHSLVTFYIRSKGFSANNNNFRIQWEFSGTPVGTGVVIRNGQFGFNGLDTATCQVVSIPLSFFGITSVSIVNSIRITGSVALAGGIGFFIDDLCMQGQPLPDAPSSPDEKVKVSSNDTTPGYLNGKLVAGTGVTFTENNDGLNETLTISAAVANTFNNGITATGTLVQLGGDLVKNTTINTTAAYTLTVSGDVPLATNVGSLLVRNNAVTGTGIDSIGGSVGISSTSTGNSGYGVYGVNTGTAGTGGFFEATQGGIGVHGRSQTGIGGTFSINPVSTTGLEQAVKISRSTQGTATNNIGSYIGWDVQYSATQITEASRIATRWTDVSALHSSFEWYLKRTNSLARKMSLLSTGQLVLDNYNTGVATFTGTPTFNLSVDTNGNVIQTAIGSGISANNGLSLSSSTVQLGGNPLIQDSTISTSPFMLTIESSHNGQYVNDVGTLVVINTNDTGQALSVQGEGANTFGLWASVNGDAAAIHAEGGTQGGAGEFINSVGSPYPAVAATNSSASFATLTTFNNTVGNTNNVVPGIIISRATTGTAAAGIGVSVRFGVADAGGGSTSNTIISKWTNATAGAGTSQFIITGVSAGVSGDKLVLNGTGALQLPAYTTSAITGTATNALATDSSGNVIQIALPSGGMTNPMTNTGDTIYSSDNSGTPARLGIGSVGQVLTVAGGVPTWATPGVGGSVTSVAQSFTGGLISVSGSPITTSGTLALTVAGTSGGIPYFSSTSTWASSALLAANAIMIGGGAGVAPSTTTTGTGVLTALSINTGSAGAFVVNGGALGTPSSGTATNLTGLPLTTGVTGTLGATNGGTGQTTVTAGDILYGSASNVWSKLGVGTNGQVLTLVAGLPAWVTVSGTGTVTSVNASGGSTGLTFSGGPITNSGTLTMAGTLAATSGGTGQTSYAIGDILYASTTTALSKLAGVATGNVLISGGVSTAPSWGKVDLTTHVSNDLPFANLTQGSARSVLAVAGNATADFASVQGTANQILRVDNAGLALGFGTINLASGGAVGTSVLAVANGGTGTFGYTNGQLLIGNTTGGTLVKSTLTAGTGITITNGAGSITIASSFNATRQTLTDATTITWNINNGEAAVVTLGNIGRTLNITNPVAGRTYIIEIVQDGTGNRTITTWPTGTTWVGGAPTLSTAAGAVDTVTFYWNGSNYRAIFNGPFA